LGVVAKIKNFDREVGVNRFSRWWARFIGTPARMLAKSLSGQLPNKVYGGVRLTIVSRKLDEHSERFFSQTEEALAIVAARAPNGYAQLRRDVNAIVLLPHEPRLVYNSFQLAVLVPVRMVLERDPLSYGAWLLFASGLSRGKQDAIDRAKELLSTLEPGDRERITAWLSEPDGTSEKGGS
jgi:hypothetical protein